MKKRSKANGVELNGSDNRGDALEREDTDLFSAEQIVQELEKLRDAKSDQAKIPAWKRVEDLKEERRLREALRDLHDEDFLDDL